MYTDVSAKSADGFTAWMAEQLAALEGNGVEQTASAAVVKSGDKL
jgi:heme/copper-type cytochrome/quinol oxidase subunit 2